MLKKGNRDNIIAYQSKKKNIKMNAFETHRFYNKINGLWVDNNVYTKIQ